MDKLLTVSEAADFLGVANQTLYNWVNQRRIPHVKLGKKLLFNPEALKEHIEKNSVQAMR